MTETVSLRDSDTDDDGLTDGQEVKGITSAETGDLPSIERDASVSFDASPTDPDTDGDGYWDGWLGVYGVNYSDNVVLYAENLRDEGPAGITGDEIVSEQTGIHRINTNQYTDAAMGVDLFDNETKYHSNVHLGERHWGTDPTAGADTPDTRLDVEVDYLEGRNPFNVSVAPGIGLPAAIERNYRLYGLQVELYEDDRITEAELEDIPKTEENWRDGSNVTPSAFNRYELDIVEDEYHQNGSRMHMFWGSKLGADTPKTGIDSLNPIDYENAAAMAFTNGAPQTHLLEEVPQPASTKDGTADFGVFMGMDELSSVEGKQAIAMHELGHALSIGWADDDPIEYGFATLPVAQHGLEVYSGDTNGNYLGVDETPEFLSSPDPEWSLMIRGVATDYSSSSNPTYRFAFSIEELLTVDLNHIPSREEDEQS